MKNSIEPASIKSQARLNAAANQLVTLNDLEDFKQQIFSELRKLLKSPEQVKKWIKSREVRTMLDISAGKLNLLRANKELNFTRLGGIIYYDRDDIEKMLERSKSIKR